MTPTTQSPETRAREIAGRYLDNRTGSYDNLVKELSTLITKADALDWLESHANFEVEWNGQLPIISVGHRGESFRQFQSLLSAITEAMKD